MSDGFQPMTSSATHRAEELTSKKNDGQGVHHLGYRSWSGWLTPGWTRWLVISILGIRRSWQNKWLKRMLYVAWFPMIWLGAGIFFWEQAALYPDWRNIAMSMLDGLPHDATFERITEAFRKGDLASSRHTVWALLIKTLFRYSQPVMMVMVVGLIAPPLISQDLRSRAFLLYFSRPLTRGEYVIGKLGTLWAYLALISTIPALTLYIIGVLTSPNLSVIGSTWDIPIRIVAASVILMLPTSALALCFSSLTQESRNAGFAWFAVWILGWFTYAAVSTGEAFHTQQQFRRHHEVLAPPESAWTYLSLYHTLGRVQHWVFGFSTLQDAMTSMAILVVITVVSLSVLFYRISAPMRV
jgi:hypothetical protein